MSIEEIIESNYQYVKEIIEGDIEYLVGGDCIYSINPKEEAEDIISTFKKLEKANKDGVLLKD